MKRYFIIFLAITALLLASCNTKVNLYSDECDSTIVYAMLDAGADTNFFKITKSFVGNANELAQNYEANNYKYDEIEVKLTGVFDGSSSSQTVQLDTVSRWIPYNENSTFYSGRMQTYYYTTEKLKEGEEYKLEILRKADNVTISSKATTINSFDFQKPMQSIAIIFTDVTNSTANVEWRVSSSPFKSTAAYFDVTGYFHYSELMPGALDTVRRTLQWHMGSGEADRLYNTSSNLPYYVISYTPSTIFNLLKDDKHLSNNSPAGVQRWFEAFEFNISAIGEELYTYYLITNSTSAIQDTPNYTNVDNGIGIMSSRVTKTRKVNISEQTRGKIKEKFEQYGFN